MTRTPQDAYDDLIRRSQEIALLESCLSLLGWDHKTYMPPKGSAHRAEQVALLAGLVHQRVTDPKMGDLLAIVEGSDIVRDAPAPAAVNVREIRRTYDRETKVPEALVTELARTCTQAEDVWVEARRQSDFALFRPWLEKVIGLKRQEAQALSNSGNLYDALLDEYEPGETSANLARVFADLRNDLVPLVQAIGGSGRQPDLSILHREYPIAVQEAFGRTAAAAIGFDFEAGRLDVTTHPFCSGIGPGDTRLTTRYNVLDFVDALFGVLHETGHGLYDQGLDPSHYGTPMGSFVSLGIHESQSRLWENLVGRSRAFWEHFYPKAQQAFPGALGDVDLDDFYFAINDVRPSFIRTEADEVTYNLHVLLRFELEQALISGVLTVGDLPGAWNETLKRTLNLTPPDDRRGCLQDIHWSGGAFGYFPTYTLGNLYAAQFFAHARGDLGDLDALFRRGEFPPLRKWLKTRIHRQGQRHRAADLVRVVTGEPLNHRYLLEHLRAKFGPLYGV
jgi:carboxypeptidase Taq